MASLVVFQSAANNLTVGDTTIPDGVFIKGLDIFIRDRNSSQTSVVSRLYAPMESNGDSSNTGRVGRWALRGFPIEFNLAGAGRQHGKLS